MSYTVIARKYRPQTFAAIVGQGPIVTTLKNSLRNERAAHAYLFTGSRGTGKTTFARLLAKALNCRHLTEDAEPCNNCPSCIDITAGKSLDVIEIDGASNRGIDDIRAINETVHYATSSSKYRIYIIDEVHMLTKEAFNALLKTLEEPPPNVKFFMATTEPQRVPATIISRCQRFDLARISTGTIAEKLEEICKDLGREASPEALRLIAHRAEGGLRDAESLLDQLLSFSSSSLSFETVNQQLGLAPRRYFFTLDEHFAKGNSSFAFQLVEEIMNAGYDPVLFLETLAEHYRMLLLLKYDPSSIQSCHFEFLDENTKKSYLASANHYTLEQCLFVLDLLVEWLQKIGRTPHIRIALECILTAVLRSRYRVALDVLVRRVEELEGKLKEQQKEPKKQPAPPAQQAAPPPAKVEEVAKAVAQVIEAPKEIPVHAEPAAPQAAPAAEAQPDGKHPSQYETIVHFAAVELEGSVKIHSRK